jgi:rubrerythrin
MENLTQNDDKIIESTLDARMQRRSFLRYAGAGAAAIGMFAASCKRYQSNDGDVPLATANLTNDDFGVLNYAYALEQLEAAFYIQVAATPYSGISSTESAYLTDIRDHEVAHRELFKAALGTKAIAALTPDFSSVNFSDRTSVLATAKAFEDTGVSAYNGAGYILTNATYLTLAGKIVSVEARHAALLRDMISYGSFADSTALDANALDLQRKPSAVLAIVAPYVKNPITSQLP